VSRVQIAFLTGRSNPRSCALSPLQQDFLRRLAAPGRRLEPLNFPYQSDGPYVPVGLLRASVNNTIEYLTSRGRRYRERYRPAIETLLARAPHTVLLAGSCGVALFANLRLAQHWLERTTLFAFGPVGRSVPACHHILVQGRRDWLSRCFHAADHSVDCNHLDYLTRPEVLALCEAIINQTGAAHRT